MAAYSTAVLQCSPCITIIAPGVEQRRLGWAEQDTRPGSSLTYWSLDTAGQGLRSGYRREEKISLTRAKSKSLLFYIMSRNGRIPFGTKYNR